MIVRLLGPRLPLSERLSRAIIDLRYHGALEHISIRRPRMLVGRRRTSRRIVNSENRNISASLTSELLLRQNVNRLPMPNWKRQRRVRPTVQRLQ